jgi:hypothetical protein
MSHSKQLDNLCDSHLSNIKHYMRCDTETVEDVYIQVGICTLTEHVRSGIEKKVHHVVLAKFTLDPTDWLGIRPSVDPSMAYFKERYVEHFFTLKNKFDIFHWHPVPMLDVTYELLSLWSLGKVHLFTLCFLAFFMSMSEGNGMR